jgi:chaperonin GroEL (HSP60 family)
LLYLVPFATFLAEKVARLVLWNAASVAALLLTTDVVVIKKSKSMEGHIPEG